MLTIAPGDRRGIGKNAQEIEEGQLRTEAAARKALQKKQNADRQQIGFQTGQRDPDVQPGVLWRIGFDVCTNGDRAAEQQTGFVYRTAAGDRNDDVRGFVQKGQHKEAGQKQHQRAFASDRRFPQKSGQCAQQKYRGTELRQQRAAYPRCRTQTAQLLLVQTGTT